MKTRPGQKIQIKSVEELLGVVNEESAMDIEIYKIGRFTSPWNSPGRPHFCD